MNFDRESKSEKSVCVCVGGGGGGGGGGGDIGRHVEHEVKSTFQNMLITF